MESVGQKLRESREQHNFSVEQVARDTHISKQYLEALEEENFTTIPGETYIIGFLRNYAEYLSLNPEEIVTLYKNIQIQEQPLPMTELLEPVGPKAFPRILVLVVVILAVLGVGGYLLYRYVIATPSPARPQPEVVQQAGEQAEGQELVFQDEAMTRWFSQDDTIGFPLNGNTYRLQLIDIGRTLTVKVPGGTLDMTVGQDRQLDVNGDGRNDLRILLNDLDAMDVAKRANLSLYKITKATPPQVAEAAGITINEKRRDELVRLRRELVGPEARAAETWTPALDALMDPCREAAEGAGFLMTPVLVVNGVVVHHGSVPTEEQIREWLVSA